MVATLNIDQAPFLSSQTTNGLKEGFVRSRVHASLLYIWIVVYLIADLSLLPMFEPCKPTLGRRPYRRGHIPGHYFSVVVLFFFLPRSDDIINAT